MIKLNNENNKWVLNTELNLLSVNDRKDAIILLFFLNNYEDDTRAFKELKSTWINNVYKLPKTSSECYNSVKNGRYNILARMRRIHKEFVVVLPPEE